MTASPPASQDRQNGLATALNIIIAPREAFESLRIAPTWGWAFLIALVLGIIGTLLSMPASMHSVAASLAHQMAVNPQYAQMSDAQRAQMQSYTLLAVRFGWVFVPILLLLSALLQTVVMLIFNAIGGGSGTFKTLWACAMNIAVPAVGLYLLASGIIALARGPAGYNSSLDSFLAMPSLAWLFAHSSPTVVAFFSTFSPFSIWAFFLTAAAMLIAAHTSKVISYSAASLILLIGALLAMWGGSRS